ncbi:HmuY family protein [Sphingobacterium corticibacterium]|uniref:Uncharacterized protein n=1 Tax=Sphingobacterium corticibacterium TaxID=2484746 RepID=A0A4Q6XMN4_9SPHI|nr:HmuY family protein [Sphingobacterium corticibacterium]RZF61353.1 hypothetical protein EWE74_00460 [Sphingobacterium corticibacterium]
MNKLFRIALLACFITVGFTSCEKDNSMPDEDTDQEHQPKIIVQDGETKDLADVSTTSNTQGTISRYGERYTLRNFRQFVVEDNEATENVATTFYFDFKENDAVAAEDAPLTWIAEAREMGVQPNTAKGYTLSYIDKRFGAVTADDEFTTVEKMGIAFAPTAIGWATYNMQTHTVEAVAGRTLVLSKDGEPQFKFQIRSIYSDETPNNESGPTNYIYYTVDYQDINKTGENDDIQDNENYYKLIRVENLPIAPTDEGSEPNESGFYFYSLSENKSITQDAVKSSKWDLAFGGMFTSFLSGNNGTDEGNRGVGSNAIGGIAIVESTFDDVKQLPAGIEFKTGKDVIGTDDQGAFGAGIGWYLYDFDGKLVREGAEEDKHVAYALAEPITKKDGAVIKPRTVIVKTANGDYAKIKMISCYKDLFSQEEWKRGEAIMYATFEYVLIPGDRNTFEIR